MTPRLHRWMPPLFRMASLIGLALTSLAAHPAGAQQPEPAETVTVSFVSEPAGAQVSVDGRESCIAPCKSAIFRGNHVIGMSLHGHLAHEELIDIQKARTLSWKLEVHKGRLSVSSEPGGLSVLVRPLKGKGERQARTPIAEMELPPGTYLVKLTDKSVEPMEQEVVVPPGESVEVEFEPRTTMGTLAIRVVDEAGDPDSADLFIDSRRQKGAGPWQLKPGRHQVVVKKEGKTLLSQEVEVQAGDELEIDVSTGSVPP